MTDSKTYDSSISGYLTESFEGISRTFTDFEEVATLGHNRLVKAKRYGTLTQWTRRWPDISERILRVNRFIYDYCERLDDSFSSDEKRQILEAMLDEWQKWNQHISQAAGKSYKQTSGKKTPQH